MGEVKVVITTDSKGAITGISDVENKISSSFKNIQSNTGSLSSKIKDHWVAITAGLAAFSGVGIFLKDSLAQAYEAEIAFNKLKIQIEGLGIVYESVSEKVEKATKATSVYAIVQEEDAAKALQQMTFLTGDLSGSMKNLNLAYDLAYQKGISTEEATNLVGKAFTGNVEMLGRYIPELRNLDATLGANATTTQKAAFAMALLEEKSGGALAKMTEHEKMVRQATKAWADFKEETGKIEVTELDKLKNSLLGLKQMVEKKGLLGGYFQWATTGSSGMEKYLNEAYKQQITEQESAEKKQDETSKQKAAQIKAENDANEAKSIFKSWAGQDMPKLFTPDDKVLAAWDSYNSELSKVKTQYEEIKVKFKEKNFAESEYQKAAAMYQGKINELSNQHFKSLEHITNLDTFEKLEKSISKTTKSVKEQVDVLKTWRDAMVTGYDDAIKKMDDARTRAEGFRSGAGEIGSFLTGFNAGPKSVESEKARIKELLSSAFMSDDKASIMSAFGEAKGFLNENKGLKDMIGFNMDFGDITQGVKDLQWHMGNLGDMADREGNRYADWANKQITAISSVDEWMTYLNNDMQVLETRLASTKELKIDTTAAQGEIEKLTTMVTYLQSLLGDPNNPEFKDIVNAITKKQNDNARYDRPSPFLNTGAQTSFEKAVAAINWGLDKE